jgi:uncharacterized protein
MPTEVRDNPEQGRFEVFDDGELAGHSEYHLVEGAIAFDHTEVDRRFEGRGLGSTLARAELEEARRRGLEVLPYCPFVRSYLKRHREYVDLVPAELRASFDLA